jgi:hypothetical protein
MEPQSVKCNFYVRTPSKDDKFHYDRVSIKGQPGSDGSLSTFHPPVVDDRVLLIDQHGQVPDGVYRVIERGWLPVAYGSASWPHGAPSAQTGPTLNLLVEECDGMFMNESDLPSPFGGD